MGEVILAASGKGGTGKSMFVSNIGTLLAQRGFKTAILDMDMGLRNMDMYMGLENNVVYNIMDVLSGVCRAKRAFINDGRSGDNLYLMAATPGINERDITPLHMEVLCEKLKGNFDYIIIDSPGGMGENFMVAAAVADRAVIVTEPEFASLRDADNVDRYLAEVGVEKRFYVVNKARTALMTKGLVPGLPDIAEMMHATMIGVIQYDDNIYISTNNGRPIVLGDDTYISKNFNNILERLIGE